jgi:hypothetical protein
MLFSRGLEDRGFGCRSYVILKDKQAGSRTWQSIDSLSPNTSIPYLSVHPLLLDVSMFPSALLVDIIVVALPLLASAQDESNIMDEGRAENNAQADMSFFQRGSMGSFESCYGKVSLQIDIPRDRRWANLTF